ncbi:MAG: zf-HC2 domain-containing protein [Spirochaetaceae bacterium]|nr:MAG: zf-HC2 domain-containing protein [Spirochaetaceae bacterium]
MSCPNPDLLSAYFDGEIQSPWAERIREHIDTCERCQKAVVKLEDLRRILLADQEPAAEDSLHRTRERLQSSLSVRQWRKPPLWRARISVPLPAVAAILLVFLGMGSLLIFLGTRPNFPFMSIKTQPSGITEVQVAAPIEDLEQLLKSLDKENVNQQIVITLPEDTEFLHFGEPRMLRADEYSRRVR